MIAYFIDEELKLWAKLQKWKKIPFASITHYFGYQGRGSTPSLFDCNLASTYGFTAGVLIRNRFTGLVTSARGLTGNPHDWKVGGVPLISLMKCKDSTIFGKNSLMIPSEFVDLNQGVFQWLRA